MGLKDGDDSLIEALLGAAEYGLYLLGVMSVVVYYRDRKSVV